MQNTITEIKFTRSNKEQNTGGRGTSKRGYHSRTYKKFTTPKTYKNKKTENYNSDEGEKKTPRKTSNWGGDS